MLSDHRAKIIDEAMAKAIADLDASPFKHDARIFRELVADYEAKVGPLRRAPNA